ncbi:ribosomal protein S18 acetylase RimI-like enzyme [Arthrobacter ulcerisalmonis]|nr:ribosomal protein S18 acetylase RimI-like enzyme [Arthrobacter ulcerisalmonis]
MSAAGEIEPAPLDLEAAMDAAWPALERHDAGGWVLRAAGGVTQRANSVWPRALDAGQSDDDLPALLADARSWYRSRRLPVIFQVFDDVRNAALNAVLDEQGFTRQSETVIMVRGTRGAGDAQVDAGVGIAAEPSEEWLRLWWDVDGRGGGEALATARKILTGCPSLYALLRDDDGTPAAVGRLAVPATGPGAWGGLYGMATRPDVRRRGYAARILRSLVQAGTAQGLDGYWLLVTAANHGAQELYAKAGFREAGRYLYRQERPRRSLTGC